MGCPDTIPREGDPMTNLAGVVQQLKAERDRVAKDIARLDAALAALNGSHGKRTAARRKMSAEGRARIVAGQKARWAKVRASRGTKNGASAPKRTLSAAGRKRIAAAQRARWAKMRAKKKAA